MITLSDVIEVHIIKQWSAVTGVVMVTNCLHHRHTQHMSMSAGLSAPVYNGKSGRTKGKCRTMCLSFEPQPQMRDVSEKRCSTLPGEAAA